MNAQDERLAAAWESEWGGELKELFIQRCFDDEGFRNAIRDRLLKIAVTSVD